MIDICGTVHCERWNYLVSYHPAVCTYILARELYEPTGDVEWFLPSLHHPRQPVEGSTGVRAPHRLVQRGDRIVVLLSCNVWSKHIVDFVLKLIHLHI